MSRRRASEKRSILPDPKFGNEKLAKFINRMMHDGKKSVSERIAYNMLDIIKQRQSEDPLEFFLDVVEKLKPMVEVKSRRVGGATYPVPVEVRAERREALSMRWLIEAARKRGEKSMDARLANEVLDAANARGNAVKKRDEVHRMAEANRAFSHYRF